MAQKRRTVTGEPSYVWREGTRPPKGVSAADLIAALNRLPEPSPERLYEAAKAKTHPLHNDLWGRPDSEWAREARLNRCRYLINAVEEVIIVAGQTIQTRAVEFVSQRWATVEQIVDDPVLTQAHLEAINEMMQQAAGKFARFTERSRIRLQRPDAAD